MPAPWQLCLLTAALVPTAARRQSPEVVALDSPVDKHPAAPAGSVAELAERSEAEMEDAARDAAKVSRRLWLHAAVRECLCGQERDDGAKPSRPSLVQRVWDLELKHVVLAGARKKSLLGFISKEVATRLSSEKALQEEILAAERKELVGLKQILEDDWGFAYDAKKEACGVEAAPQYEATFEAMSAELSEGCSGTCSKLSAAGKGECREQMGRFCPEGTRCSCSFERQEGLAAVVFPLVYLVSWGTLALLVPGGAVMPGPFELSTVASFLIASKVQGCGCVPAPCAWDEAREACAPGPHAGARNPFQAALPYLGQSCAPRALGLAARLGLAPPGCELRPCLPQDAGALGQVGNATFNCQLASQGGAGAPFPSLQERLSRYSDEFPEHLKDFMLKGSKARP